MTGPTPGRSARRARRAYIAAHHPDRGGDPDSFRRGLEAFGPDLVERHSTARPNVPRPAVTVYRRGHLLRRLLRSWRRRRRAAPPRVL